jgi:heme/copper-type cytochrome/quinol oxidase subunit 1
MGESLARISFWTILIGLLLGFVPLFFAGAGEGQVIDAYKYFDNTGVTAYNVIASIGVFVLFVGILLTILNAIFSRTNGPEAGHDPWGGDTLEWFTLSPPEPHNFDVLPDVRSPRPLRDIREAIGHRTRRSQEAAARESQPVA